MELVDEFADCIRREWNACGLRKGYMYMADIMTDPRWQCFLTGMFGDLPELVCAVMSVGRGIQGSKAGVTADGVAVTTKHFPGGGARENGFILTTLAECTFMQPKALCRNTTFRHLRRRWKLRTSGE